MNNARFFHSAFKRLFARHCRGTGDKGIVLLLSKLGRHAHQRRFDRFCLGGLCGLMIGLCGLMIGLCILAPGHQSRMRNKGGVFGSLSRMFGSLSRMLGSLRRTSGALCRVSGSLSRDLDHSSLDGTGKTIVHLSRL